MKYQQNVDATWAQTRAQSHLLESAEVFKAAVDVCMDSMLRASECLATALGGHNKLMLCGNGGSAADCQHMAAEFVSRLTLDFERPALAAIALTTDTSFLTAFANDFGYEGIFERQIQGIGQPGDVLIGISTSGNSKNVVRAIETARNLDIKTITLTGSTGCLQELADIAIAVPSTSTQSIQETHLAIEHILCDLTERMLFGQSTDSIKED